MKLLVCMTLFSSIPAIACPKLEGNYLNCYSAVTGQSIGISDVKVRQEVKNGINIYKVSFLELNDEGSETETTDVYTADKIPVVTETNGDYVIQTTSWCEGDLLKVTEELMLGDAPVAYAEGEFSKFENSLNMDYILIDESGDPTRVSIFCK